MNIGCTVCPARYAVPDAKIVGRKVRVTCKRCGSRLVVDGTSSPPRVSTEQQSRPPGERVEYHVAQSEGQKAPLGVDAIVELYEKGTLDASTLVWREGMSAWAPLFEVDELASALARRGHRPPAPASHEEPVTRAAREDTQTPPEEEGDVTRIYRPAAAPSADEDSTQLFSSGQALAARHRSGGWNEPAKWKSEGPRDPIEKVEWREQGALAADAPRVAPRLPGGWSERGVEDDEVTRMMKPFEELAAKPSDSERPLTGQRSEASVLFSLRGMAGAEEPTRRRGGTVTDERALVARASAPPLTADVNLLAPPSSTAPPPAKRFQSRSELPALRTAPPAPRGGGKAYRPVAAVLGVSLVALVVITATDRWSLVTGFAHSLWQRLSSLR